MELSDLISPEGIISNLKSTSKKQALQEPSRLSAGLTRQRDRDIYETLLERDSAR